MHILVRDRGLADRALEARASLWLGGPQVPWGDWDTSSRPSQAFCGLGHSHLVQERLQSLEGGIISKIQGSPLSQESPSPAPETPSLGDPRFAQTPAPIGSRVRHSPLVTEGR